jgi:hypothetical protein
MKTEITGEEEDLIFKNRQFIRELNSICETYFDTLSEELSLNENGRDWLFDYINNHQDDIDFLSYLDKFGVRQEALFQKS